MTQYCPHTATCPFYQNWKEQTPSDKIDIIFTEREEENPCYDCLALITLNEGVISMKDELKSRLLHPERPATCYYIKSLNLLAKLDKKLK